MTCRTAKHIDRSVLNRRFVLLSAFSLMTVFLFIAGANLAHGESPVSVVSLVPEATVAFEATEASEQIQAVQTHPEAGSTIELTQSAASPSSIVFPTQDTTIDFLDNSVFVDSFDLPTGNFQDTASSVAQNIEVRRNVLGCKGCYNIQSQDELWIVSARDCSCAPENIGLMKVRKLENNCWQESSLNALSNAHLNDTGRTTMLYVHGNQTDYEYGVARGVQFYDNLFVKYECPRAPVRLVLWLWQSERAVPRLYSDYIVKSRRAVTMGKTLTKTLEALGDRRLAIVGFSLGAQVVLSSLEQMEFGNNCPGNNCFNCGANQLNRYNVALIAPATDPGYICGKIDRSVQSSIVSRSTVIVNDDDRAVKAMRFVIRHECPEAHHDFCKLARCNHLPLGAPEFFEISQEICRKHSIVRYTKSPTTQRAMTAVLNRTAAAAF